MVLKEDDLVLCTVKHIEGTTVFVKIEDNEEGNIVFSEVSPGRIRNIREFVTEGKKIVCKVLRIQGNHIELSLRRVTMKERDEVLDRNKKERVLEAILKPVLKEKTPSVIEKIRKEYELADFLDKARENQKLIERFVSKQEAEVLAKIFVEKGEKEKEIKKIVFLKTISSSGLTDLKKILETDKAEIKYLGSSRFAVIVREKDFKTGNVKMDALLKDIEAHAKELKVKFEVK